MINDIKSVRVEIQKCAYTLYLIIYIKFRTCILLYYTLVRESFQYKNTITHFEDFVRKLFYRYDHNSWFLFFTNCYEFINCIIDFI